MAKDEKKENEETSEEEQEEEIEYELDEEGNQVLDEDGNPIPVKKKSKKKLIIIIVLLLLILGGGGAGVFFSGILGGGDNEEELSEEGDAKKPEIVYMDLDEFLVNLNNPGKQVSFLKMTITLELEDVATQSAVESKMPRIRDTFQIYLRELRNTDLQGSAALHRLREELLLRINSTLDPDEVSDILFKEIMVQ